jgi:hypothetical protein
MARTKNNQRSASRVAVDVGATGTKPASKGAVVILAVSVLAASWAVAMMTAPGRIGYLYFFMYSEFYMGVITLVSLSITIMVGLVSTDRLVLSIRQRVLLQSTHRTTGVIAVTSLFVHVWTKVVEHHIGLIDAFVPFMAQGNRLYVGYGTLSGWIMMLVMWTGMARARFIGRGQPWMWRSIHAISYLMWPIALVHGLSAGRAAKPWVIVSYVICILLVLVGLAVRLSVSLNRRKDFSSTATGALKPVGKLVPTNAAPAVKKRPSRREQQRIEAEALAPVAVVDAFTPVATAPPPRLPQDFPPAPGRRYADDDVPAPRQRRGAVPERYDEPARPASRRVMEYDEDALPRGGPYPGDDEYGDYDEPAPRARRYPGEQTGTRMRRPDLEDTQTRMRRAEMEDTRSFRPDFDEPAPRRRRYADEDDAPVPRSRRRAEEPRYDEPPRYPDSPRGSRHADTGELDDLPRQRGSRYAGPAQPEARYEARYDSRYPGQDEDAPRARRDRGADIDRADSGRHSRSEFVDLAGPADDPNYLPPDDTPTLVDMASRRARRATQQEAVRGQAGRGARRAGRGRRNDDAADDAYWSQLRGEAN